MAKKKPTVEQLAKWCAENPTVEVPRENGMVIKAAVLGIAIPAAASVMQAQSGASEAVEGGEE